MTVELRQMTAVPTLMRWRIEVIRSVFGAEPHPRLLVAARRYYRAHAADGSHIAFVALADGHECGCGSMCLTDELPSPDNPTGRCACLMSIYVRESYRRRGIAGLIVRRLVDEARSRGCGRIWLEATPQGRPVYASAGFVATTDMMTYSPGESGGRQA